MSVRGRAARARGSLFSTRAGRRQRGPVRVAQPRHPHRRRPGRASRRTARALAATARPRARARRDGLAGARHRHPRVGRRRPPERATPTRARQLTRSTGTSPTRAGLGLLVLVADCLPVALAAPAAWRCCTAAGAALAGGIIEQARRRASTSRRPPRSGPGIGPCCYEVGRRGARARSPTSTASPTGAMLDLRAVADGASCAAAGVERDRARRPLHGCRAGPVLLPPPRRRRDRPPGRDRVADRVTLHGLDPAIRANLERVRERIAARRDPGDVRSAPRSSTSPADELPALAEARHRAGRREPRAGAARQAGRARRPVRAGTSSARSRAARSRTSRRACALIHSVASRLGARDSSRQHPAPEVLIQVNVAGEEGKAGIAPAELGRLHRALPRARSTGLMTMPPFAERRRGQPPALRARWPSWPPSTASSGSRWAPPRTSRSPPQRARRSCGSAPSSTT